MFVYLIAIAFLTGAAGAYWNRPEETSYITEDVVRKNIEKVVNATGEVRAIELVTVGAQVSGKIEKLYVTIGQTVKKGEMIAEIDSTTQQNDVDINKAKLSSYEAQLTAAKTSLNIAKKQYKRLQNLRKRNAASDEDLENAQETYETAKSKVAELESSVKETQISLSTAETNLGYTKITAPLDGTIVSIPVKVGQTINAAMDTPTIVQIADLSQMEILIEISEGDISNVKPGIKVTYTILADMNDVHETTLKSIDPGLTLLTNDEYTEVVDEVGYYYTAYAKALNSYGNTEQNYLNAVEITKYYQTRYNSGKIEFKDYLEAIHKQNSLQDELIQQKYQIIKYENYVYKAMAGKY